MSISLFICDTPFQVLTSLYILQAHHNGRPGDFILTDNMAGAGSLARTLGESSLARDVFVADVKHGNSDTLAEKARYARDLFKSFDSRWVCPMAGRSYDTLYVRNFAHPVAVSAYSYFKAKNDSLRLVVYDEGYSNYSRDFWFESLGSGAHQAASCLARVFCGKQDTFANISMALLYVPGLLDFELPFPIRSLLPLGFCAGASFVDDVNRVFGFNRERLADQFGSCRRTSCSSATRRLFIFFEESFAVDRGNDADLKILGDIVEIVGKGNILVKLHPRSSEDRFTPLGYRVMEKASYPWEVFALNAPDDCDLTLISFSSGSLLNYHFLVDRAMRSVFLYDLYPDACQTLGEDVRGFFEGFLELYPAGISVPKNRNELCEALA